MAEKQPDIIFRNIQFVSDHSKLSHSKAAYYARFEYRENLDYPVPSLEKVRNSGGFDLKPIGVWSINFEKGIGIDPKAPAIAITADGIQEGSIGEFAASGLFRLEMNVVNKQPIPNVDGILVELKWSRRRSAPNFTGSLPNLEAPPTPSAEGLISEEEVAGIKKETAIYAGAPHIPRIPGVIQQWIQSRGSDAPIYLMIPDPSILGILRGSLRIALR